MVVAIGREAKRHRYQLEEIAGNTDNVIEVQSFKQLSKSLRRLREVTCSEYHHVLVFLNLRPNGQQECAPCLQHCCRTSTIAM